MKKILFVLALAATAAATLGDGYKGAGVLWRAPERAKPFVLRAYASATDPKARLAYAKTLGLWGDGTGSKDLAAASNSAAAELLAAKLKLPGICGHDCPTVESVPPMGGYGVSSDVDRSLVELSFARALLAC